MWVRSVFAITLLGICGVAGVRVGGPHESGGSAPSATEQTTNAREQTAATPPTAIPAATLSEMDMLSEKFAETIRRKHFPRVLVLGAAGPNFKISQLGTSIGEAFTVSLEKHAQGFEVISRGALLQDLQESNLEADMALTDTMVDFLCMVLHAKALILIRIDRIKTDVATASVYLFQVQEGQSKSIVGWQFQIPLDDAVRQANPQLFATEKTPASPGATNPQCIYCPRPDYTSEARKHKFQGGLVLSLVVSEDGLPRDIRVVKSGPWGLDEKAIEAVKKWKFKPPKDRDGKPVSQTINVQVLFATFP